MSYIIGIDFGLRHWGLARGIYGIVEPITSIKAVNGLPDFCYLHALVKPWYSGSWVIGLPLDSSGDLLLPGKILMEKLPLIKENLGGEIFFVNEFLTTVDAREKIVRSKGKKYLTKNNIDSMSACCILERYFDEL